MKYRKRKCSVSYLIQYFWSILTIAFIIHVCINYVVPANLTTRNNILPGDSFIPVRGFAEHNKTELGIRKHSGLVNRIQEQASNNTNDSSRSSSSWRSNSHVNIASGSNSNLTVTIQGNKSSNRDGISIENKQHTTHDEPTTIEGHLAVQLLDKWKQLQGDFILKDDDQAYIIHYGKLQCLKEGTDLLKTFDESYPLKCVCKLNWYGQHCSIPIVVHVNNGRKEFVLRTKPRRIIQSFLYNGEWEMLSHRLHDTGDLIDAFIIQDAVYTGYGDPKNTTVIPFLLNSSLPDSVKRKILPNVMFTFPKGTLLSYSYHFLVFVILSCYILYICYGKNLTNHFVKSSLGSPWLAVCTNI